MTTERIGSLLVELKADTSNLDSGLERSEGKFRLTSGVITKLAAGAGLAIAGIGVAAVAAANQLQGAYGQIQAGTGATGESLEGLKDSFHDVFGETAAGSETVATALADMNTRFGFTGDMLEETALKAIQFSEATGGDGVAAMDSLGRAMVFFGEESSSVNSNFDKLVAASQASGASVEQLSGNLQTYGAVLSNAGFTMEESTALFAEFHASGVDVSRIMPGLNAAFRRAAEEGKSGKEVYEELVPALRATGDQTEALTLATDVLGAEGAQRFLAFANAGDEAGNTIHAAMLNSAGATETMYEHSLTLGDQMGILKNQLIEVGAGAAQEFMPLIMNAFETITPIITRVAESVVPLLTQAFEYVIPVVESLAENVLPLLEDAFSLVVPVIQDIADVIMPLFIQAFQTIAPILREAASQILPPLREAFAEIGPPLASLAQGLLPVFEAVLKAAIPPLKFMTEALAFIAPVSDKAIIAVGALTLALKAKAIAVGLSTAAIAAKTIALGISTTAMYAAGAALRFMLGPIGLVTTAIGVLTAGAIYLYKNWDEIWENIRSVFARVSDFISAAVNSKFAWILPHGILLKGIQYLWQNWDTIWSSIRQVFESVTGAIAGVVNERFGWLLPGGSLSTAISAIGDLWGRAWDWIREKFASVVESVLGKLRPLMSVFGVEIPEVTLKAEESVRTFAQAVERDVETAATATETGMQTVEYAVDDAAIAADTAATSFGTSMESMATAAETTSERVVQTHQAIVEANRARMEREEELEMRRSELREEAAIALAKRLEEEEKANAKLLEEQEKANEKLLKEEERRLKEEEKLREKARAEEKRLTAKANADLLQGAMDLADDRLDVAIDHYDAAEEELEDFLAEMERLVEDGESVITEEHEEAYQQRIAALDVALEEKLEAMRAAQALEIEELRRAHAAQLAEYEGLDAALVEQVRQTQEAILAAMIVGHESQLNEVIASHVDLIGESEDYYDDDLSGLEEHLADKLDAVGDYHDDLDRIEREAEARSRELYSQHREAIEKIQAESHKALQDEIDEHVKEASRAWEEAHKEGIKKQKEYAKEIREINEAARLAAAELELAQNTERNQRASAEHILLRAGSYKDAAERFAETNTPLKNALTSMEDSLGAIVERLEDFSKAVATGKQSEIDYARKRLVAAEEASLSSLEELDSLLAQQQASDEALRSEFWREANNDWNEFAEIYDNAWQAYSATERNAAEESARASRIRQRYIDQNPGDLMTPELERALQVLGHAAYIADDVATGRRVSGAGMQSEQEWFQNQMLHYMRDQPNELALKRAKGFDISDDDVMQAFKVRDAFANVDFDLVGIIDDFSGRLEEAQGLVNEALGKTIQETAEDTQKTIKEAAEDTQKTVSTTADDTQETVRRTSESSQRTVETTSASNQRTVESTSGASQATMVDTGGNIQRTIEETSRTIQSAVNTGAHDIFNTVKNTADDTQGVIEETSEAITAAIATAAEGTQGAIVKTTTEATSILEAVTTGTTALTENLVLVGAGVSSHLELIHDLLESMSISIYDQLDALILKQPLVTVANFPDTQPIQHTTVIVDGDVYDAERFEDKVLAVTNDGERRGAF